MKLKLTPKAMQDLKNIKKYISDDLNNPTAANRIIRKIMDAYLQLPDSPFLGVSLSTKIDIITPYRYLISGNHLIFYKVNDDFIEIIRIIDGRRDYIKILFHEEYKVEDFSEDYEE